MSLPTWIRPAGLTGTLVLVAAFCGGWKWDNLLF
jgi:hypothetical protein